MLTLFRKYVKQRFMNKILFSYTAIVIIALMALALIIYLSVSFNLRSEAVNLNRHVVENVVSYIELKYNDANIIIQNLYTDTARSADIFNFLQSDVTDDKNRIEYYRKLKDYLKWIASVDSEVKDVSILKQRDRSSYQYIANYDIEAESIDAEKMPWLPFLDPSYHGPQIYHTYEKDYGVFGVRPVYNLSLNIWNKDITQTIGVLSLNFDTEGIHRAYAQYEDSLKGYILVLTKDGNVIYDSSKRYYDKVYPYFKELQGEDTEKKLDVDSIVNVSTSQDTGVIFAGIIPRPVLEKSLAPMKRLVAVIDVGCIICILALTYIITNIFSKRIKTVYMAMNQVEKGDLTIKLPSGPSNDEIDEIASSFNHMCEKLDIFIQKEYISEIKRKDAELKQRSAQLYSLQAQINPHFLFNTLEIIRMGAIDEGCSNTGEMIRALSLLFRSNISKNPVVSVREELDYCSSYIRLYDLRFGGQLETTFEIDDQINNYAIFKYLLQPVIENCIVHGFDKRMSDFEIILKGSIYEGIIMFEISDNGIGISEEKVGAIKARLGEDIYESNENIGLLNIHQRIRMVFGNEFGVDIHKSSGKGTCVTIRIPARTREELESIV